VRLVLLHALPFDGRMWTPQAGLTAGPTVTPRLYGLGASLEEWAAGVLEAAGDDDLVVVGCSVGGSCALEVARAAPDRVLAVVLVGAKAAVRPDPVLRDEAVAVLRSGGMAAAWERYWRPLFGPATPPGTLREARAMALAQDVDDVVRGVRAFHDRRDLTEFVEGWRRPLVVVNGRADRSPSPATAAALAAAAPDGRLHVVDGCGHYVNLERPAELGALIEATVAEVAAPA
jgi:pimeloyl-ACP methyl ester carboxylesterase